MVEIKIENVVASATIGEKIDIEAISMLLDEADYEPEQFPGLIYHIKEPKVTLLIFRSGKVVCTGAKSIDAVRKAIELTTRRLRDVGIPGVKSPEITVQNMVATWDIGQPLDLTAITLTFGLERVEYEPEQFPGLIFRLSDPKVVMLFFGSGKVVCTGARSIIDLEHAVEVVEKELKAGGFIS